MAFLLTIEIIIKLIKNCSKNILIDKLKVNKSLYILNNCSVITKVEVIATAKIILYLNFERISFMYFLEN